MTTTYGCPMHPEVEEDKPGECPACGMSLEREAGSVSEVSDDSEQKNMSR